MVPDGWVNGKVEDLIEGLESGVSVNGDDRELDIGEKAVLKVSAVTYGVFNENACKVISGDELNRAKTTPKAGQIIISRSNTEAFVGASAYIEKDYNYLFLPDKLWQTIPKSDLNMKWLSYVLASSHSRYVLSRLATGTSGTMKNITKGELLSLKVSIPPVSEQNKIADILTTWDEAITTTKKLLTNSQQHKKVMMQKLLTGKKRFPDFSGEWGFYCLKDMGDIISGGTPDTNKNEYWNGDVLWMTPTDVTALKTRYINNTKRKITCLGLKNSSAKLMPAGSLLVCTRATVGLMSISNSDITTNQGFKSLVPNNQFDVNFLYYLFSSHRKDFIRYSCGSTFLELSKKDFESLTFICPSHEEQKLIAKVLSSCDSEIEGLQSKMEYLRQEKKALMQQLLTGKRRVKIN